MCYRLLHHAQTVPARRGCFRLGLFLGGLLLLLATEGRGEEFRRLDQEQTPPEFATLEEWLARAHELRTRIMVSAGLEPLPARTPLNPRLSPPLARDGYTVQNVTLETLPGFYLTGNLYRPWESIRPIRPSSVLTAIGRTGVSRMASCPRFPAGPSIWPGAAPWSSPTP